VRQNSKLLVNRSWLDRSPELNTELGANAALILEPLRQVVFNSLGRDFGRRHASKDRPQELQGIQVLLMIALAPKRRLGTAVQKPLGPLIECELFAVQNSRETAFVARRQAISQEALGFVVIGRARRLSLYFSFLVPIPDLPKPRVSSRIDAAIAFARPSSFAHSIPPFT
jgi:hypothetical protein